MGIAQRKIIETGNGRVVKVLFNERCVCGNPELTINKEDTEYATCLSCMRVVRKMEMIIEDGKSVDWWGVYFDPYLKGTLVGNFIEACCGRLPEDRYPLAPVEFLAPDPQ